MHTTTKYKMKTNDLKELPNMIHDKYDKMRGQQNADASAHNAAQLFAKVNMIYNEMIRLANLQEEIKKNNESCWRDINGKISDLTAMLNSSIATMESQGRDVVRVEPPAPARRRQGRQEAILALMADGRARHVFNLVQDLKDADTEGNNEGWPENSVYGICGNLARRGTLIKVQRAVYQLKESTNVQA